MGVATAMGNSSYSICGALGGAYELGGGDFIFSLSLSDILFAIMVGALVACNYRIDAENSPCDRLNSSKVNIRSNKMEPRTSILEH